MGLLGLFSKGPLSERKIAKVAKLAANPFAQPDVRMREMQRLVDDGSAQALRGVLRRFAANAQGHIADEDEKKWLEDALVQRGESALGPLRDYIRQEDKLTYALRAFRRIAGEAEAIRFFLEVLKVYGPEDYRSSEAKLQFIWQLSESLAEDRVLPELTAFLQDHSDDVRWAVLDLIERAADKNILSDADQQQVRTTMRHLVTDPEVSPRIARRSADLLANREWRLPDGSEALAGVLEEDFFIDKKRYVRRRNKKGVT